MDIKQHPLDVIKGWLPFVAGPIMGVGVFLLLSINADPSWAHLKVGSTIMVLAGFVLGFMDMLDAPLSVNTFTVVRRIFHVIGVAFLMVVLMMTFTSHEPWGTRVAVAGMMLLSMGVLTTFIHEGRKAWISSFSAT